MNENDGLQILIEAALDFEKSLTTMTAQMNQLQEKFKSYQIKITAGLNQTASAAQIKKDLKQINAAKNHVRLVGQMDQDATKKNVAGTVKKLKNTEVQLTGLLDTASTQKNVQEQLQQLRQIPQVEAKANVSVEGAEQVDQLSQKMDKASNSASNMAAKVYLARTALQALRRAAQEAKDTVVELDKAATDLAIVTGSGSEEAYVLLKEYNQMAQQLGATTTQISDAAAEWLRQGKTAAETATLIEQSMILSKVGAMESATATQNLTSAMKGYGMAVEDVSRIVDKLTAIDLKAAVTASDLAVAMSRTANSANISGVSMDRLLGYLATVEEVTQKSAETIGESFKTIFARMGNIKLGNYLDDDGEDLSDVETVLKSFGIALRGVDGDFRNFAEVLDDVYAKWEQFGAIDKRAIANAFAGTRQQENFLVLMENYGNALEYAGVAADSAGTALEKFSAYEDSIGAKAASFTAALESLTMDTIDSNLVKDLIDAGTAVVEFAEKVGLLKAALISLGAGGVIKGVSLISSGFKTAYHEVLNLGTAINTMRNVDTVGGLSADTLAKLGKLTKGLSDEQLKLVLTSKQLSAAQMKAILMASGLSEAEAVQKIETLGLAASESAATGATWSLSAAMTGLGASIKAAFMSNPVGLIMLAVSALVMAVETVTNAQEEARQAAIEAANTAATLSDEVVDLTDRYLDLSEAVKTDESAKEDLLSTQDDLIKKLGLEKGRIEELVEEYGSLTEAIKAAAIESLQASERDLRGGLNAQEDELLSKAKASGPASKSMNHIITTWGGDEADTNSRGLQALADAGYISDGSWASRGMELWLPDDGDFDLSTVEGVINAYERLGKMLDVVADAAGSDNEVYEALYDAYNKCSTAVGDYQDSITALNSNLAEQYMLQGLIGRELPASEKEFNNYRQSIIDAAEESGEFIGSDQDIADAVDTALRGQSQFAAFYADTLTEANDETGRYIAQLSNLPEVLSELKSSYGALSSAESDMAGGGGLSADTIDALAGAEENYLDYLYEENGVIKLNTAAWKENANAKMLGEMDEIQKEIDSLQERNTALQESIAYYEEQRNLGNDGGLWSSMIASSTAEIKKNNEAIAENQGKLAIYSSLYGSITGDLDAYTAALSNFSNVSSTIDFISSSFQTLADLQAEVANGFTMSLEKAMEFAAVYPEILNSAQATADGQIALNEGVVNSFIQGKQAELDTEIDSRVAVLEARKAVREAQLAFSQSELDLAKSVGEGESQIAKEVAEYRLDTANQLVAALIEAGVDEATAFQLACTAMAGNTEEFDRIAMEVCTDVNDNFNQAAYGCAQAIYQNMNSAKRDVASLATQAQQTADAIAGMANGVKAGSSAVAGGSGGGSLDSGISLNLSGANFQGTDYSYEAKSISLDDFISDLELDISNYQSAISQIDGQIAALQALKNLPLKSFQSDTGSGGSSSSSTKEVEEYIATIDDYREAIERLRKAQETRANIESKIENSDNLKEQIVLERQLIGAYEREQNALHDLNNQRDSTITAGVEALRELGFAVQYNADTNELWIANMEHLNELVADSKGGYDTLQEATNGLRKETEDLINSLTDLNEENRDGSESWKELGQDIKEARKQIMELLDGIVEEASDAVDTIQNVYDTLHDAADEYAQSGFITVDTLQSVRAMGQKYLAYLIDENGQLVINEERIRAVIAAKTQELAIESSLSYIEALRIAKQEGDIATLNNLLYATEEATDATWGFVYANLALAGLDEDQYQAALKNINALRALADSACESIGQTANRVTNELEEMQTGLTDILDYVMDMLKQRIQDQIDGLEDMKDAYSEIIDLKKQSLEASKDEADAEKSRAAKLKEIAKLQARIDALSLDDSREAQAEKAALLEELSELQSDLADEQADRTLEAQEDALDKMEESYHDEKDKEIEILEDSISSYQKLYDMAISYIESHWDTLYGELISWNTQYGDGLNSEITTAWDNCLAAAQRYGSYVSALNTIGSDIQAAQNTGSNLVVGNTNYDSSSSNEDMIHAIIKEMYSNSQQHHTADAAGKAYLNKRNLELGAQLAQYGITAVRGDDGVWYVDRVGGQLLYEKYKKYIYHEGGIVGGGDVKSNEQLSLLKTKEWVLSEQMVDNLTTQMDRINMLSDAMCDLPSYAGNTALSDVMKQIGVSKTVNNITNNSRPIELQIGDTIIHGADQSTVEKHIKVTRNMVNQIGRIIGIGR